MVTPVQLSSDIAAACSSCVIVASRQVCCKCVPAFPLQGVREALQEMGISTPLKKEKVVLCP
jgi:hypothetical protein